MVQLLRNNFLESVHYGSAVVVRPENNTIIEWGDVDQMIFPRSALKIIQAIPFLESGAVSMHKLGTQQLALACSSHQGSPLHTTIISNWLKEIGLSVTDLKCGVQPPSDKLERDRLRGIGVKPSELHNNCSGKHASFLTFSKHKNLSLEYLSLIHI